jgi:hypothetical protein
MARIVGTSGAWKSICAGLNNASFYPEKPSEISRLLESAQKEYALAKINATQEVQNRIESLKKDVSQLQNSYESNVQKHKAEIGFEIELIQLALDQLQDGAGLIQRFLNRSRVKKQKEKLLKLKIQHRNCPQILQKEIDMARKTLEATQKNQDSIVGNQCKVNEYNVNLLQSVLSSPDMAGALAELEVIEQLRTLPDNYFVISDIKLVANKSIHFDGEWLKSAQIDHVVVSPSGIFVIEVKNWSKNFTQDGDYFDPYQQVKRASYLCYKLVGQRYNLKTRSIIAHKGFVPEKPSDSFAKVLELKQVKGYIERFKEPSISDQIVELVANRFRFN